jgi:O-antigen/teichoic acid export membrane protein
MARSAAADVASQAVSVGLIALFVATDRGLYAIIAATVVAAAVNMGVIFVLYRRLAAVHLRFDLRAWRRMFVSALPLGIALIVNVIYFRLDAFLLSLLKGARDVGIYGIAFRFSEMLTPFPLFFVASVFPAMAAMSHDANREPLRRLTQRTFDVLVVAGVPVVVGAIVVAPEIVHAIAGPAFADAVVPLRLIVIGTGAAFVATLFGYLLIAIDRQKNALWLNFVVLALNLALNLALIPPYGYTAAAAIASGTDLLIVVGELWLIARFTSIVPSPNVALRALLASAAMAAAVLVLGAGLIVSIVVGALVYFAGLYLLRVHVELDLAHVFTRRAT